MAIVEIKNIRKVYPNGTAALQGVSLDIQAGEIFGLLGPNGAGKTTLLNIVAHLLLPDDGAISILGKPLATAAKEIHQEINLASGHANFAWSLTLRENLRFYGMLYGLRKAEREPWVQELLERFALAPHADKRFDEVSTGTKQRLALAKAMLNRPKVLLLDEPTVGLDPDVSHRIREFILDYHRTTNATLILTTHYMQEAAQLCQRIAFIREGKIHALGTPKEIQEKVHAKDLEEAFMELAK